MLYRNTLLLFLAEGFTALATAMAGLMIARLLPVAEFGAFSAAFAFAQIMAVLVDSGMGALTAKNIARDAAQGMREFDQIFTWRVLMITSVTLLCPLFAYVFLPTANMRLLAAVLTPALLLLTMTDFVSWVFKGFQRFALCVVMQVGSRTLLLALCALALISPRKIAGLLTAYGIAGVAATALALGLLARTTHAVRFVKLPRAFFIHVLPNIYKLGGIIILNVIFSRLDVMLVAKFCGGLQTGLYGGASRVVDGLRMMPTVALGICLPMFSAVHDQPSILRSKFLTTYMFLLTASLCVALAGSAFAGPLFAHLLGPSYAASALLFQPLVWSCVLMYANMLMFALLYALNDHRTLAIAATTAIGVDVALNISLLPHFGPMAASWSRLLAEGFFFSIQARSLLRRQIISLQDLFLRPCLLVAGFSVILIGLKLLGRHFL